MTSSNLDSTYKKQPALLVASWNILYDHSATKHQTQAGRLRQLADDLHTLNGNNTPDILFVCEGAKRDNLYKLAEITGLCIVQKPFNYRDGYMAFMVRPSLLSTSKIEFMDLKHHKNTYNFLKLSTAGIDLVGTHYNSRLFRDMPIRAAASNEIVRIIDPERPTVIMGDFNSLYWTVARRKLGKVLHEVHESQRPRFPMSYYRGKSVPKLMPSWNIDAIYVSKQITALDFGNTYSSASDHPLLYASLHF